MKQVQGLVIKVERQLYTVIIDNKRIKCSVKGEMLKQKLKPCIGDYVTIEQDDFDTNVIVKIKTPLNQLQRPRISNVDKLIIILSGVNPTFNHYLLDKYLILSRYYQIKSVVLITKKDLLIKNNKVYLSVKELVKYYSKYNFTIYFISNIKNTFLTKYFVKKIIIQDQINVLTGPSGVGKSSLINILLKNKPAKTQSLSKTLNWGKQTTRTNELYQYQKVFLGDTPGFSDFNIPNLKSNELKNYFPIINNFKNKCNYANCMHINEPNCVVIRNIKNNNIFKKIYKNYCKIFKEMENN